MLCASNNLLASDDGPQVKSPSFDCEKAGTKVEREICSSSLLSGLDIWMSEVYKASLKVGDSKKIKSEQRTWLKSRASCLNRYREGFYGNSGLETCYSNRIRTLIEQNNIELNHDFYNVLAKKMGIDIPSKFVNKGAEFIFSANLSQLMQGFFDGHCSYNKEEIVYYKSPILITNINGSTVCGGTSHRIYGKYEYCEKNGEFHEGGVWVCKPENILDKEFLLGYIAANSFDKFYTNRTVESKNNIFIDYLYSFPIHSLAETSANHPRQSRIFTDEYLKIVENNFEIFSLITKSHKGDFKEVVFGMDCALEAIKNTPNWENIFKSKPRILGKYWYGRQFKGCDTYDKHIIGEFYTYKELYVALWRHLYFSGGMDRAIRMLNKLKVSFNNQNTNA